MTMRLDIVTNDAGELVRREHARELGGGVVVAIYRLAKLAQMHDLANQAFIRQLDQTYAMIGDYCLRSGGALNVLFADKATFVAGQLLKGNRGAYEAAAELGTLLERIGGSELNVAREVTREDLHAFAEQLSIFHRTNNASQLRLPRSIVLRPVADAARLRGIELEDLTPDQRIVRAYGSAVVIMRRFYEDLSASRYVLPRRIKRIAQSLVDLSDARATSFLGVTEVRNANYDEAGRAVNTAILAVAIAREATEDRSTLAHIAMAAMMHDVARPRALALAGAGAEPIDGMAGPSTLSEDQEDRLAAGAAAVLTALGRVNEPTITRTVLAFEALWLRRQTWLGPVYWGAREATLHSSIIAVARRYNDLLTPEPGLTPPTTDYAVAMLSEELTAPKDRIVLRMLVSALGLLPVGTLVRLATGEVAEVVRGAKGIGDKPRVLLLTGANGVDYPTPTEIELADDPARTVVRVLAVDGWSKGLAAGPPRHDDFPDELLDDEYEHVAAEEIYEPSIVQTGASGPSFGSTPSSVAQAMGRVVDDAASSDNDVTSFYPGALAPAEADEAPPDHTVVASPLEETAEHVKEPTARGNLDATPVPHVLAYLLDHALSGSVVFTDPERPDESDIVYFENGVPAKVRLRDPVLLLGDVLVSERLLDSRLLGAAVDGARDEAVLLGRYLLERELISAEGLAWGLQVQLLRKIEEIVNRPSTTEYAYYKAADFLDDWGENIAMSHPLNPILFSVRAWSDRDRLRATLARIGEHPLVIHGDADLAKLATTTGEATIVEVLRARPVHLADPSLQRFDAEHVASLAYTFAVTRLFAFEGQNKPPMVTPAKRSTLGLGNAAGPTPSARPAPPPLAKIVRTGPVPRAAIPAARPGAPQIRPIAVRKTSDDKTPKR